jgi:hypothetical protein
MGPLSLRDRPKYVGWWQRELDTYGRATTQTVAQSAKIRAKEQGRTLRAGLGRWRERRAKRGIPGQPYSRESPMRRGMFRA